MDRLIFVTDIKEQNRHFGTSLLLANIGPNTAMTPKFINSSHAALLENVQIEQDIQTKLKHTSSEKIPSDGFLFLSEIADSIIMDYQHSRVLNNLLLIPANSTHWILTSHDNEVKKTTLQKSLSVWGPRHLPNLGNSWAIFGRND